MAKDKTKLYNDVISSPEFQSFLNRTGGVVNSGPIQVKRSTIQVEDEPDKHRWLFFANGYIREQNRVSYHSGNYEWRASPIAKPPANWPDDPSVDDMLSLVEKAVQRLDKRDSTAAKRSAKFNSKRRVIIDMLFDPESYQAEYMGPGGKPYYAPFRGWVWIAKKENWNTLVERIYSDVFSKDSRYTKKQ